MKMNKRKLFLVSVAVCLIAILSMSTLAWFSADDSVLNEFNVATSTDTDADDIFSIDVWEKVDPENDGTATEVGKGDSAENTTASYTTILPGDVLTKEAYVKNTGFYDQYVRVTVTISDAAVWEEVVGSADFNDAKLQSCFGGFDATMWDLANSTSEVVGDNIVVTLYYKNILKGDAGTDNAGDEICVFKTVNIPSTMTQAQAAKLTGGFTVKVVAEAVQTENLGTAANAFDAFTFVAANP